MMAKQRKQLLVLLLLLVVVEGAYFGLRFANSKSTEEEDIVKYPVTTLTTEQVTAMTFTNDNGTFTLRKDGDNWILADDTALDMDESMINSMISNIAALESEDEMTEVTDLSIYGLDHPVKTIMISDGTTTETVFVGDYNDTVRKYYICLEGKTDTVYTASSALSDAFDKTLEDLIAESETSTEETETNETATVEGEAETIADSQ